MGIFHVMYETQRQEPETDNLVCIPTPHTHAHTHARTHAIKGPSHGSSVGSHELTAACLGQKARSSR
jgi:hypothetical protein